MGAEALEAFNVSLGELIPPNVTKALKKVGVPAEMPAEEVVRQALRSCSRW